MSSLGVELYKKYTKSATSTFDPCVKLRPSDLCSTSSLNIAVNDYPKIVEFNNIADNTAQVRSSVDIDHPLFQPSPNVLVFEDYSAFSVQEKKLFFRNNDSVSIRFFKPCGFILCESLVQTPEILLLLTFKILLTFTGGEANQNFPARLDIF